ncbi:MAG: hypothetical protein QX189_16875, partial [Methylococcales bacterium]
HLDHFDYGKRDANNSCVLSLKNVFNRHSKGGNDAVFLFFIAGQLCVFGLFLGHHHVFRVVLHALKAFVQPQSSVGRNKSKGGFFIKGFFIVITTRLSGA